MSATIPENMLLSDLLKSTGYDCPDSLKDKTFDESTSSNIPSDNTGFSVRCYSLSEGYITCVVFPRSAKVTAVTKTEDGVAAGGITAGGTQEGFAVFDSTAETGIKFSVVYDGDTYSYTYSDRDFRSHELVKENS